MKRDTARETAALLTQAFSEKPFLQLLKLRQSEARRLLRQVDWTAVLDKLLPLKERFTCQQVLRICRPMLDAVAPEPDGGWLPYAYRVACSLLFPHVAPDGTPAQRDAAVCFLQVLQVLLDAERRQLPFDPASDFSFCTEEEIAASMIRADYRRFLECWRQEYVYEMLRLGREVTPFRTLDHIAGVHHVSMTAARSFAARGGLVDPALISGAAAGHDLGKFGCRAGERVPYLHYHYTNQWFAQRGLESIGHIAANHSVWDLEIENLSAESLMLVYADFRVKQERDKHGGEIARIYSLTDAFDVILSKLDNVDDAKTRRYRFVYAKLRDFEEYLRFCGADVELDGSGAPAKRVDAALLNPEKVVEALRRTAVEHNIRLMHRLSHDQLFASVLEAAHSEKEWSRLRAYISVLEEYFTYLSSSQKMQTLDFLYEQLLNPDGDIRRQAATLIGHILAKFHSGYIKEQPDGTGPDPEAELPFRLWADYLGKILRPDRRLTPLQISKIRYTAKLMVDAALEYCDPADAPRFLAELLQHYQDPAAAEDAAFALMDTVTALSAQHCGGETAALLERFSAHWLRFGDLPQKAAALRLDAHLLTVTDDPAIRSRIAAALDTVDTENSAPLLFCQTQLRRTLGMDVSAQEQLLDDPAVVSNVFLDNLKTATPWILKALGVEYLLRQTQRPHHRNILHIATHFSNLIKVSEHVVVRRLAGISLLEVAPALTPDRRNEIAVELSKALETGQSDLSKYIPEYLGRFILWLTPRELDEVIDHMQELLSSSNSNVVAAALGTIGSALESYAEYGERFSEDSEAMELRRRRLAGLLLKGLAGRRTQVRQEALRILGEGLFASHILSYEDKTSLFTLCAKKILCLVQDAAADQELTFFYTAAALSHLYRFIVLHHIEDGEFRFTIPEKAAFFPGTFDPFSLSHKGIVQAIRELGFEVYLAIDEFSWSKKAQPSLIRRQLVSMSVADEFDVYVFPHDIPVNLANPADLDVLRAVFAGRDLYLAVGSDVLANASSYKAAPAPGSVHHLNHIVFRRASSEDGHETRADLGCVLGDVLQLQLPTHLEDISSSRIRENIDLGRDISNLIDPSVQDFIYRNSLYLREPQYKRLLRAGDLDFSCLAPAEEAARQDAVEKLLSCGVRLRVDPRDTMVVLRDIDGPVYVLGALTMRTVTSTGLYEALGSARSADYIRDHSAGRICLITGIHTVHNAGASYDSRQLLLTESLFRALGDDCSYAVFCPGEAQEEKVAALMQRSGFLHTPDSTASHPLMLTDMRSPVALIQNLATTLKEPFSSDPAVLKAIRRAHRRFQQSVAELYPGTAVLSLNAELIHHRLVRRIVEINGVPAEPTFPRVLGSKMCAPFGKILRGNAIPNTVTKTIHTDKVFAPDLRSFTIREFPGYAPLKSQIRTILSFRREVILVDDLLHSGARVKALEPLLRRYDVPVDRVLVGLMSGRGKDLMAERGIQADCVYFIPNLRSWFVESTMYPFIGGDTVADAVPSVPGLTPAVNLIMPYTYPSFYRDSGREAVMRFSRTCIENSRNILLALESSYRSRYARNLTLSRLSEAVILPLSPDKGASLHYDPNLAASACLESDLQQLLRLQELTD